jgi:IclR family transcriptional regulator, KDG regulon repressor
MGSSLRRNMLLIEAIVNQETLQQGGTGVVRLAELAGLDKSQASRALRSLEMAGLVQRDPHTLEYRLGWRLPSLMLATKSARVLQSAHEAMRTLCSMYPETVEYFCVLRDDRVHALYSVAADGSTKKHPWGANGAPCYCTSTGRALLCDLDVYQLREEYPAGLELAEGSLSPIRTVEQLASALKEVRSDGYAAVDSELESGLAGVAAPIREFGGKVVAAINVSGVALAESPRLRRARLAEVGQSTAQLCARISARLGWTKYTTS